MIRIPIMFVAALALSGCLNGLDKYKGEASKGLDEPILAHNNSCPEGGGGGPACGQVWAIRARALLDKTQKAGSSETFCPTPAVSGPKGEGDLKTTLTTISQQLGWAEANDASMAPSDQSLVRGDRARVLYCIGTRSSSAEDLAFTTQAAAEIVQSAVIDPTSTTKTQFQRVGQAIAHHARMKGQCQAASDIAGKFAVAAAEANGCVGN